MIPINLITPSFITSIREEKEAWIRAKYVERKFVYRIPPPSSSATGVSSPSSAMPKRQDVVKRGTDGVLREDLHTHERKDVLDMDVISGHTTKHASVSSIDSLDSDVEEDASCLDPNLVRTFFESFCSHSLNSSLTL